LLDLERFSGGLGTAAGQDSDVLSLLDINAAVGVEAYHMGTELSQDGARMCRDVNTAHQVPMVSVGNKFVIGVPVVLQNVSDHAHQFHIFDVTVEEFKPVVEESFDVVGVQLDQSLEDLLPGVVHRMLTISHVSDQVVNLTLVGVHAVQEYSFIANMVQSLKHSLDHPSGFGDGDGTDAPDGEQQVIQKVWNNLAPDLGKQLQELFLDSSRISTGSLHNFNHTATKFSKSTHS
jgi:hypothetical protein